MQTVPFGAAGFDVSRLCLGTWNMSGQDGWGPDQEADAIRLIQHVVDSGCCFIDTARGYGNAEATVGKALSGGRRERVRLATKAVQCPPDKLVMSLETSLRNLQTDVIDLFICHWPSPSHRLEDFFEALVKAREAGRVRAIGVSNFNLAQMQVAVTYGAVSLQPPLSIPWRCADEILSFCRERDIAVTPYSPLAQGLLTGRFTRGSEPPTGPRKSNVLFSDRVRPAALGVAREVDAIADRLGCTSSQVALAWVLQTPGVTSPIVGASRIEQWDANVKALDVTLADDDYARLDAMGRQVWALVDPEASMWGWKPT